MTQLSDTALEERLHARLEAAAKPEDVWLALVLVALQGPAELDKLLDATNDTTKPLHSITVEGFRGIGPQATLELPPGSGLTLAVGGNGSGESSFAEALDLLLTGDTYRWAKRTIQPSEVVAEGSPGRGHPYRRALASRVSAVRETSPGASSRQPAGPRSPARHLLHPRAAAVRGPSPHRGQ